MRRRVETTISQLTQQFHISRIRARSHWGMLTRFSNKFGGFTLGVFLNKCLGRKLMALRMLSTHKIFEMVLDVLHKVN